MRLSIKCSHCAKQFYKNLNVLDRRELERKWYGQQQVCSHCLRKSKIAPNRVRAVPRKWIGLIAFGVALAAIIVGGYFLSVFYPMTQDLELVKEILIIMSFPFIVAIIIQKQEENRAILFNRYFV